MTIVVCYKWAPNPQDAEVRPDGTVDFSRAKAAISEYDPVAFEIGRRLADATGHELVGLSVGPSWVDTPLARKAALSRGLDRLVLVADDRLAGVDGTRLAAVLAAAVRGVPDVALVLTGEESVDVGERLVPALLAGELGWFAAYAVEAVEGEAGGFVVERRTADGTQLLALSAPAVLAVAADAAVPRVPGMKEILQAGKKPTDVLPLDGLDAPVPVGTVSVVGRAKPAAAERRGVRITAADPKEAATELLADLHRDGVL